MKILITGATGQLGSLIIEQLLQKRPAGQVIAGVRNQERAKRYTDQGLEVRFVDYDQPESLAAAFNGITHLLLISSSHKDDQVRLLQHKFVIQASKQAGVQHLLYTSFAFPPQGPIPPNHVHLLSEQAIMESGLEYTFLRNALYMDVVAVFGLNEAVAGGELITPPGEWSFNAVTRQDLACGTAAVLASGGGQHKRIYELTASRPWNFTALAEALAELTGKQVVHRTSAECKHFIYDFLGRIDTASTSADLEHLLGRPVTGLKDSIRPFVQSAAGKK
ncbi:NAD(P)-dependent oxidoreductase [Paenibacillus albidus]|uniref:NAD(P)-dependent oxidoreductase n=1 Tax=Paenibacillus albidus TaxID=2041023 RepID=A0A917C3F3_9BACL|nr:NAD(P)H-binding protein [Paenibacillus albidus]GGF68917.1 NAD(P)-dependent oxidoreductase [Paenibacillus albidus]